MTTSRPPSAAIRMVVRRAAARFDLWVVVIRALRVGLARTVVQYWQMAGARLWVLAPIRLGGRPHASHGELAAPDSKKRAFRPILRVDMHRRNLLTQVLLANLLLMVVAVIATGVAGNPNLNLGER